MVGQKVYASKQSETQQTRLGYMGQTNKRMQDHRLQYTTRPECINERNRESQ